MIILIATVVSDVVYFQETVSPSLSTWYAATESVNAFSISQVRTSEVTFHLEGSQCTLLSYFSSVPQYDP